MSEAHPLERAIAKVGLGRLAAGLGKTHQALRKWQRVGRLPRTEWTGETSYAKRIEALCEGSPTAEDLLKPWPKWPPNEQPDPVSEVAAAGLPPGVIADRRDPTRISPYAGTDIDRRAQAGEG